MTGIKIVSKTVELPTAWTLSSPNLIVTLPDATQVTAVPTVSPGISTSNLRHIFQYVLSPTMGGWHEAYFEFFVSSNYITIPASFFVTWTDVYSGIRNLIGSPNLSDNKIDLEFYALLTEFGIISGGSLPEYHLFTTAYKKNFDLAMVYLVSSVMRANVSGKASTGELTLMKKGTTTAQWSGGNKSKVSMSMEEVWWQRGLTILEGTIPEIYNALAESNVTTFILTRGPLAEGNDFPTVPWTTGDGGGTYSSISGSEM